jgi:hypothetical protein
LEAYVAGYYFRIRVTFIGAQLRKVTPFEIIAESCTKYRPYVRTQKSADGLYIGVLSVFFVFFATLNSM